MFARCGTCTAASAGQNGVTGRLPAIPPQAFRLRRRMSTVPSPSRNERSQDQPELQRPESIAMTDEQLQQQLDLQSPSDVFRRIFLGPRSKIRSRDINHRINAIQRRAERTSQERQQLNLKDSADRNPYRTRRIRAEQDGTGSGSAGTTTGMVVTMDLLRFQIKACNTPEDLIHVVTATAKSSNPYALNLIASDTLQHIMYSKVRNMGASWEDYDPLRTIGLANVLYQRFKSAGAQLSYAWVLLALQTSISILETDALRYWLSIYTQHVSSNRHHPEHWQDLLAMLLSLKHAIKHKSRETVHGEFEWSRRALALVTLLSGSPEPAAADITARECYFAMHLDLNNTSHARKYLDLLSRLAPAADAALLLREYLKLARAVQSHLTIDMVHNLLRVGDASTAWSLLATIDKNKCPATEDILWAKLFEGASNIPEGLMDDAKNSWLREAAEQAFSSILEQHILLVERALGVTWIASSDVADGHGDVNGGHHHIHRRDGLLQRGFQELAATPPHRTSDAGRAIEAMVGRNDSWVEETD